MFAKSALLFARPKLMISLRIILANLHSAFFNFHGSHELCPIVWMEKTLFFISCFVDREGAQINKGSGARSKIVQNSIMH